ncbi:ABC transporter ATP-binding protein [Utexia brackfieldae]|uniref:ABC transporter ATP-binding protein n=1 Tax=Utexia brackfieldae TaxID=3074108 RepID=UPI00370D2A0B
MTPKPILEINDLKVTDRLTAQPLIDDLSLSIYPHRVLAIVGESGSGKSLLAKAIMGLLPTSLQADGQIYFQQTALFQQTLKQWQAMRGKRISLIVQNAMAAFDPLMTIGDQFAETLQCHFNLTAAQLKSRINKNLSQVNLLGVHNLVNSYPHQLSGGQLQRVMIAIALALEPDIIIADEPTTALDAITQYDVMQAFKALTQHHQTTLIFITHDLGLVKDIADDIAVMKAGQIVELNDKARLLSSPQQAYTKSLLASRQKLTKRFDQIMGKTDVIKC